MSYEDIIRAWKDEEYRLSLSEEERALLPDNPAGLIELTDDNLEAAAGGVKLTLTSIPCVTYRTYESICGCSINGCWP